MQTDQGVLVGSSFLNLSYLPPEIGTAASLLSVLCISPVITLRVYCSDVFICQSPLLGCVLITGRNHVLHLSESTSLSTRFSTEQMLSGCWMNALSTALPDIALHIGAVGLVLWGLMSHLPSQINSPLLMKLLLFPVLIYLVPSFSTSWNLLYQ